MSCSHSIKISILVMPPWHSPEDGVVRNFQERVAYLGRGCPDQHSSLLPGWRTAVGGWSGQHHFFFPFGFVDVINPLQLQSGEEFFLLTCLFLTKTLNGEDEVEVEEEVERRFRKPFTFFPILSNMIIIFSKSWRATEVFLSLRILFMSFIVARISSLDAFVYFLISWKRIAGGIKSSADTRWWYPSDS